MSQQYLTTERLLPSTSLSIHHTHPTVQTALWMEETATMASATNIANPNTRQLNFCMQLPRSVDVAKWNMHTLRPVVLIMETQVIARWTSLACNSGYQHLALRHPTDTETHGKAKRDVIATVDHLACEATWERQRRHLQPQPELLHVLACSNCFDITRNFALCAYCVCLRYDPHMLPLFPVPAFIHWFLEYGFY